MIPVSEPKLFNLEKKLVKECLNSNWISSQGPYVEKFEKDFAKFNKIKYALCVSNCTVALHLSLLALGIGKGDEVICPSLSFISPANMVRHVGAKLVLVDVNSEDLNINANLIKKKITKKTKAIIVVHQFGSPANIDQIIEISKKYKIKIIEDNAESIGSKFNNKLTGLFGDLATYSFFGNKILTTGEGGMIITNKYSYYKKIKILRDHGLTNKKKYIHSYLGFNYRMTNLQAAIGIGQLKNINKIIKKKAEILEWYKFFLKEVKDIRFIPLQIKSSKKTVNWLVTIYIQNITKKKLSLLIKNMFNKKVDIRRMIQPVYKAKHFNKDFLKSNFPISEEYSYKSLHLPSSTNLSKSKVKLVCDLLKNELK